MHIIVSMQTDLHNFKFEDRGITMYSPKINEKHIPILYQLGRRVKRPMTHLVNEAVTEYLSREVFLSQPPVVSYRADSSVYCGVGI